MLKASNNNFGTISKIKIPKTGFFCNLKSTKVAKKIWKKIFSTNFGRLNMHKTLKKTQMKEEIKHIYFKYINFVI